MSEEEKKQKRNWPQYNEHLVQRGEILLSLESLKGWQRELEELNQGKNGRPFGYPQSLILFLGTLRVVFHLPYRQLEGLARGLKRIRKALGDGSYDTHDNFTFLAGEGIEAGIKVREDANPHCGGKRGDVVRAYLRDPPQWKKRVGYGQRWMVETFFSGFKRLFVRWCMRRGGRGWCRRLR